MIRWKKISACALLVLVWDSDCAQGFAIGRTTRTNGSSVQHSSTGIAKISSASRINRRDCGRIFLKSVENVEHQPKYKSKNFRLEVFQILTQPVVEVFSMLAVFLSTLIVALSTLDDLPPYSYALMNDTLLVIDLLFAIDFFLRWYAAGQFKAIYLTKPLVVLDIVVILVPLIFGSLIVPILNLLGFDNGDLFQLLNDFQDSAGRQNLLLLRILRLRRVLTDFGTFRKFVAALPGFKPQDVRSYQLQLARVLLSTFTLLSVSTGLIYSAEHDVNPDIPDYFSALYFGLTTLTTVGIGDITPVTAQGRLIVSGSILFGIAIIPAQTAKLVDIFVESQKDEQQQRKIKSRARAVDASSRDMNEKIKTKKIVRRNVTNGMGPSGVELELPTKDVSSRMIAATVLGRTCDTCNASPHRADAIFCWSCGSAL